MLIACSCLVTEGCQCTQILTDTHTLYVVQVFRRYLPSLSSSPAPTIAIHNPMMPMMDDFTAHCMAHAMHHNAPNQLLLPPPPYTHRPASPHSDTPYSSPTSSPLHSPYLSPCPSPGASPCPSPTPQLRAPSAPTCKSSTSKLSPPPYLQCNSQVPFYN